MRAVQIMEPSRKSNSWFDSASKPCAKGPIGWPTDFTQWLSTWRAGQLPKSLRSLKFIDPTFACGWSAGEDGMEGILERTSPRPSADHF